SPKWESTSFSVSYSGSPGARERRGLYLARFICVMGMVLIRMALHLDLVATPWTLNQLWAVVFGGFLFLGPRQHLLKIHRVEASEGDVYIGFGNLFQHSDQLLAVPVAAHLVECDGQNRFVVFLQVHDGDVDLFGTLLKQHLKPLIAADKMTCPAIPYQGLDKAEVLDRPP